MTYFLPDPNVLKDQRRFDGLMITVLRTALFREIKVCLIGRNGRACSQSFYQENILIIKTFCPFVLLSIIIICSYVIMSKNLFFCRKYSFQGDLRDMWVRCWLDVWTTSNPRETLYTSMFQAFWVRCWPFLRMFIKNDTPTSLVEASNQPYSTQLSAL